MNKKARRIVISCRIDYVSCWEPKEINGVSKYRVTAIIKKDNKEVIDLIYESMEEAKKNYMDLWGGEIPKDLIIPIHDGDLEKSGNEAYENAIYFNATSNYPPEIVNKKLEKITNRSEVYSGCHVNLSLRFYGYNFDNKKGIAVGLGNIQKLGDDVNLSQRLTAKDEFAMVEEDSFLC